MSEAEQLAAAITTLKRVAAQIGERNTALEGRLDGISERLGTVVTDVAVIKTSTARQTEDLEKLEGRVAAVESKALEKSVKGNGAKLTDHEARIRSIERMVWKAAGAGAVGGALGATLLKLLL